MRRLAGAVCLAGLVAALVLAAAARPASQSRYLLTGIFDDAHILGGDPATVLPELGQLHVRMIRVTLWWGGPIGVAPQRPAAPADPADAAYRWATYDRIVRAAGAAGIRVMFTIVGTPSWESGIAAWNRAPRDAKDLEAFATAAARRYDGTFRPGDATALPAVRYWTAWNEPNSPVFLRPQYRRVGRKWIVQSGRDYAHICNAVVAGVKSGGGAKALVACGVTAPRGNNQPTTSRASVSPLAFLQAMWAAGARGFDAYAHHPYYGAPSETPSTPPPQGARGQPPTAVTLGNFSSLVRDVTRRYGSSVRFWITEYGYQTNPPDKTFGVSWAKQALYLRQAWQLARANPRVDVFLWFLLQDEARLGGWQSGLVTAGGTKKPAFATFASLSAG